MYYHEKWFDLKLKDGKCSNCQKGSKFQVHNKMYPGIVPLALPPLSQMEEMIISPVHALVQLFHKLRILTQKNLQIYKIL